MVFSSLFFIFFFFILCFGCYACAGNVKNKNIVLVIFSIIFYAFAEPLFIFLILFSSLITYITARIIQKYQGKPLDTIFTILGVGFNLVVLINAKYNIFIVENINKLFSLNLELPKEMMPIGISFFTFQTISYIIDCHWEKVDAQKNFLNFLMYILLFPQLIAGPIVRYSTIESEITARKTTVFDLQYGFNRLILGLAKKVIIADSLLVVSNNILKNIDNATFIGAWLGVILYSLRMYFDFSGYSDMAIGMGRIFGFHFDENFNHPFICKDITEFWQRWHISLGTFFRDYLLYIPIFGKRRKYGGLFLVWFCTGLWHGNNSGCWNFIIWGLYYGLFIFIEMKIGKKKMKSIPIVLRHIYNKIVIIIGFGIFYFTDMSKLGIFLKTIFGFGGNGFISTSDKMSFVNNMYLIIVAIICCFPIINQFKKLSDKSLAAKTAISLSTTVVSVVLFIVSCILLVDATTESFLYFQF